MVQVWEKNNSLTLSTRDCDPYQLPQIPPTLIHSVEGVWSKWLYVKMFDLAKFYKPHKTLIWSSFHGAHNPFIEIFRPEVFWVSEFWDVRELAWLLYSM